MSESRISFEKLATKNPIKETILRGIYGYGYEFPSLIQSKAIPIMLDGKDLVAQSQSGTGKTGAFVIGILQNVDEMIDHTQALIISPTRELASQTKQVIDDIGGYTHVKVGLCIGGCSMEISKKDAVNSHVLIATPGRLIELMRQHYFMPSDIKMLVLDEADVLLNGNFHDQTKSIISAIPKDAQICFFSATFTPEILDLTKYIMNNPETLLIKSDALTLEGIKQFYVDLGDQEYHKFDTLIDIFGMMSIPQCIIYVNSISRSETLRTLLEKKNYVVSLIHGSMPSYDRTSILTSFRRGQARILISTDLLARGIDIQQLSLVINYDFPKHKDTYLHRIGRSGRYGRKGIAINFVSRYDSAYLNDLRKYYDTEITELPANFKQYFD